MTKKEKYTQVSTEDLSQDITVKNDLLFADQTEIISAEEVQKIQELEKLVSILKEENKAMNDKMLREVAEAQNFKKRLEREKDDVQKYAVTRMAKEFINVHDNLGRALESIPEEHRRENEFIRNLVVGVEATEKDIIKIFEQFKIKQFRNEGEKFNPNIHRVMFEQEDSSKEAGTIIQVIQPGYMIEDRLLREALVGVTKKPINDPKMQQMDEKI